MGSSALTHLMSVDLPHPDGPHTTTTSPLATCVVQDFKACTGPYHLLTDLMSIIRSMASLQRTMAVRACSRLTSWESANEMAK